MHPVKNPFITSNAARLYAKGRPDYSSVVGPIIRRLTGIEANVDSAVDVGSGTGISTRALSGLADRVIGVEPSPDMIEAAQLLPNASYRLGSSDLLPVEDDSVDLIGAGSAVHWFDQPLFAVEAARIARNGARLVLFDHGFTGEMRDVEAFSQWFTSEYIVRHPAPPRERTWRPPSDYHLWRHTGCEQFEHLLSFGVDELASYLLTQSNLQVKIADGSTTEPELRSWIHHEITPFFGGLGSRTFVFRGFVACHELR